MLLTIAALNLSKRVMHLAVLGKAGCAGEISMLRWQG
jgi:hypothetical protein